jgi:hypothetical protein
LEQIITTFYVARAAAHRDLEALLTGLIARGILLKRTKGQRRRAPNRGGTALPGASSVARILALLQASSRLPVSVLLAFAYASVRLFGWSHTVMSWQVCFPSVAASAPANADAARAADAAIRETAALHPLNITCKERALACWALLHAGGWPAELVLGVDLFPLASHAWCESSGLLLTDDEDRCRRFTPVLRYA